MWSQLSVSSVHEDFSGEMADVLSVFGLRKYVFTGAVKYFMLIVREACLNYVPEEVGVCINV